MKEMIDVQQLIHIIRNMKPCFLDGEMSGRITFKGDIDFATEADFAVQRQVQERLLALYPDIQFMGCLLYTSILLLFNKKYLIK